MKKLTLLDVQRLAVERGGRCLSESYTNSHSKLLWECAEGHRWEASHNNIRNGRWCPVCSKRQKLTIEDMHNLAASRGGRCLSSTYINSTSKLLWECAEGHRWKAIPRNVKIGRWCPTCTNRMNTGGKREKLTIDEMCDLAKSRGGKCLSDIYVNSKEKLIWECSKGHQWQAAPSKVVYGRWCPVCAQVSISDLLRSDIDVCHEVAAKNGGRCLSKTYRATHSKLVWECSQGHIWAASFSNVKRGSWCPACSSGYGERVCKEFFEVFFGQPFPKRRPRWLKNDRGYQMELDGYCKNLKLAFEHHGKQHYEQIKHFHGSSEKFEARINDDRLKRELCASRGIALIEIPEIPTLLPLEDLKNFVIEKCIEMNVELPRDHNDTTVDFEAAHITVKNIDKHRQLRNMAREKGGKLVSQVYENRDTKMLWQCAEGHYWEATPHNIKNGTWCPVCGIERRARSRRLTIEEMNEIAEKRGGRCVSDTYVNKDTKLTWECLQGHRWDATPANIKRGRWCPKCAKTRIRSSK